MERWSGIRLEGRRVVLEPLRAEHEDGLWEASREPETWSWLSIPQPGTREAFRAFLDEAHAAAEAGLEIPFAHMVAFLPVIFMVAALPISVARLGTTQAAWLFFFSPYADEATLYRLAGQLEKEMPWKDRRPPVWN